MNEVNTAVGIVSIVGVLISLSIATTFAVLYKQQLDAFDAADKHCVATQTIGDQTIARDGFEDVRFALHFGYGIWLAYAVVLVLALPHGFNKILSLIWGVISCCNGVPGIVQIVYLGIYRFNWVGSACSQPGMPYESVGKFMLNMFIAQIVLINFYLSCASCGVSSMKK